MNISIDSTATIGKSLSVKREKDETIEQVVAHLKFTEAFIQREVIDELCGRFIGWSHESLYDDKGGPVTRMEISLPWLDAVVTGVIAGTKQSDEVRLKQATLDGVIVTLTNNGAVLSGTLSWKADGDEVGDLEALLGRECRIAWVVQDSGQKDMLRAA